MVSGGQRRQGPHARAPAGGLADLKCGAPGAHRARPAGWWRSAASLAAKDLRVGLRRREMAAGVLVFSLLVALTFAFAFDPARLDGRRLMPGALWVTVLFSGMLAVSRTMAAEQEHGTLEALLASPVGPEALFFGKMAGALAWVVLVELVVAPTLAALLRVTVDRPALLAGVLALGSVGFVGAATLVAAVSLQARGGEVLMPVLLVPLAVPATLAAVEAMGAVLQGEGAGALGVWVRVLVAYDVLMVALPPALFRFLWEG